MTPRSNIDFGDPAQVQHVCMGVSAGYAEGALALPNAAISYDRFPMIALAV